MIGFCGNLLLGNILISNDLTYHGLRVSTWSGSAILELLALGTSDCLDPSKILYITGQYPHSLILETAINLRLFSILIKTKDVAPYGLAKTVKQRAMESKCGFGEIQWDRHNTDINH